MIENEIDRLKALNSELLGGLKQVRQVVRESWTCSEPVQQMVEGISGALIEKAERMSNQQKQQFSSSEFIAWGQRVVTTLVNPARPVGIAKDR